VLSGRPVDVLERFFPSSLVLYGLYGLERSEAGRRHDHPQSGAWREVIHDVAASAVANGPAGMRVEPKGLSLTLHYREHPEVAEQVEVWARKQAGRSGLEMRSARMSVELHPPIPGDKGTALLEASEGLGSVCYLGDDLGDLAAFDALDKLAAEGVHVVRIAVIPPDEPVVQLADRADVVLDSPRAVVEVLRGLLD
jgi:trehalose 6-phosphate phosphatase